MGAGAGSRCGFNDFRERIKWTYLAPSSSRKAMSSSSLFVTAGAVLSMGLVVSAARQNTFGSEHQREVAAHVAADTTWIDRSLSRSRVDGEATRRKEEMALDPVTSEQTGIAGAVDPMPVPLQHVSTDDDDDYDQLGVMVGINNGRPRLFQLDTGSDQFNAQIDEDIPGVRPIPGAEPEMYAYGNGTYGNWAQKIQFERLSYYDPANPSEPVATFGGGFVAARILDIVFTEDYVGSDDANVTDEPVGYAGETPVYANLDIRERIQHGRPGEIQPFYGVLGSGDFVSEGNQTAGPGSQTRTGYVLSLNANLGERATPGCAPCLTLNLTPAIRAQFSALTPWGDVDYEGYQSRFPQSGANASNDYEGSYSYTLTVDVNGRERSVDLEGPVLFDTGTPSFLYADQSGVLQALRGDVRLSRATGDMGHDGWLGLAGVLSGTGDFTIEDGADVRMTGANTYTGTTHIASDGYLTLAGPGSIERSANVVVDGTFSIEQAGDYLEPWGVDDTANDVTIRNLNGSGTVFFRLALADPHGRRRSV